MRAWLLYLLSAPLVLGGIVLLLLPEVNLAGRIVGALMCVTGAGLSGAFIGAVLRRRRRR